MTSQKGSAHAFIITGLVIALISALGFVFWQNFIYKEPVMSTNIADKSKPIAKKSTEASLKTFTDANIGVTFTHPKEWLEYRCTPQEIEEYGLSNKVVYFATSRAGLAIPETGEIQSGQLCGGGSDFPPQMALRISETSKDNTQLESVYPFTALTIDGKDAKKTTGTTGSDSILPGLEWTTYTIDVNDNQRISFMYQRFPVNTDSLRDNTERSRDEFINVVEQSLRFL